MKDVSNSQEKTPVRSVPGYETYFTGMTGVNITQNLPVLEADTLTHEVFTQDWVSNNRACLIKGAISHWPAIQKWRDKDYWLSNCENFEVNAFTRDNFIDLKREMDKGIKMNYHDAMERLYSGTDDIFSMPSEVINDKNRFAGISKDITGFKFLLKHPRPRWSQQMRFFTYRRAATAWHYHDMDETLLCQVNGTKRVVLLSPDIPDAEYISDFFLQERYLNGEKLTPSLKLNPILVDVEEGDALYIPPYWHHLVVPVDGNIGFSVAFCWASPFHILGNLRSFFVRRMYKNIMTPFSVRCLFIPFMGLAAWCAHLLKGTNKKAPASYS
jgi:Cupin-like domain